MNGRLMGVIAGCCVLSAPVAALAVAGEGIRLGPTLLSPSLSVSETYDDNISRNASGAGQSDWVTKVSPALRLEMPVDRYFLNLEGGIDVVDFGRHNPEDSTNWFAGAAAGGRFTGGLSFEVGDRHDERYLVGTQEYGPGENSTQNSLLAKVAYAIRDALRLEFAGSRSAYTYGRSESLQRVELALRAGVYWKLRPSLSALAEAGFTDYSYDRNTRQDGSAAQAALGLTWEITQKSTGLAQAGYLAKRYKDEESSLGTEAADTYVFSVALGHHLTRRTKVDVELSRSSQESDFVDNPYYLRTSLSVGVGQRFTSKLYGRAGLRYVQEDYPHAASYDNPYDPADGAQRGERSDKTLSWSVGAGFNATRWLTLELEYGGEQRNSSFDTFDYRADRVSLSAKAAL